MQWSISDLVPAVQDELELTYDQASGDFQLLDGRKAIARGNAFAELRWWEGETIAGCWCISTGILTIKRQRANFSKVLGFEGLDKFEDLRQLTFPEVKIRVVHLFFGPTFLTNSPAPQAIVRITAVDAGTEVRLSLVTGETDMSEDDSNVLAQAKESGGVIDQKMDKSGFRAWCEREFELPPEF